MEQIHLKSVLHLLVLGSIAMIIPLAVVVYYATHSLDDMVERHSGEVRLLVDATRDSLACRNLMLSMERSALQYQVLGKKSYLSLFDEYYADFDSHLERLSPLLSDHMHEQILQPMAKAVNNLRSALGTYPYYAPEVEAAIKAFKGASDLAEELGRQMRLLVDLQISGTQAQAERARLRVYWFSILVIPITTVLLSGFLYWVVKPVRQLKQAIHQLGDAQYDRPIHVGGPRDLHQLGQLLNWLRQKLNDLEQQKRKFLRHISHELKTPLTGLREGIELLEDEIPGPLTHEQKEVVSISQENAHTLQRLIDNLLDYNLLMESGKVHFELTAIDQLILRIVNNYTLLARRGSVVFDLRGIPLKFPVDRVKTRAALDNLVSNAISFSPVHGRISIGWKITANNYLNIQVTDDGPGIQAEERTRIFEAFYQGETRRMGPRKGTGLGLSIVRECMHAQGGGVYVGNHPGRGACFTLELPYQELV